MIRLLLHIIACVACLWSRIYSYKLSQRFLVTRDVFYTHWIRNFIGCVGSHSSIAYPCSLQGGGEKQIVIGNSTHLGSHIVLGCWKQYGEQHFSPSIAIGNNCNIGEYNHITACNKITIGDGLLTGRFVYIGDNAHGGLSWEEAETPPIKRRLASKGEIKIGRNVWIGDKVTILGGVTIGDNVIVGANSVVTRDIPNNCVAVGMPAIVVRQLACN